MGEVTVALAADHAGYALKEELKADLERRGASVIDLGTDSGRAVDYPDFGRAVGEAVASGRAERGVVICGTGIGVSIAANRIAGVRAAVCSDVASVRLAREHNDANILALGARMLGPGVARDCLSAFFDTPFGGAERHARRIAKLG